MGGNSICEMIYLTFRLQSNLEKDVVLEVGMEAILRSRILIPSQTHVSNSGSFGSSLLLNAIALFLAVFTVSVFGDT